MPRATKQPVASQRSGCTTCSTTTKQKPWQREAGFRFNAAAVHWDRPGVPARLNAGWFPKSRRPAFTDGKPVFAGAPPVNTVNADSQSHASVRGNPALRVEWKEANAAHGSPTSCRRAESWRLFLRINMDRGTSGCRNCGAQRRLRRDAGRIDSFLLKQHQKFQK